MRKLTQKILFLSAAATSIKIYESYLLEAGANNYEFVYLDSWIAGKDYGVSSLHKNEIILIDSDVKKQHDNNWHWLECFGNMPLILLIEEGEERGVIDLIKDKPRDYLIKDRITGFSLVKTLNNVQEKNRLALNLNVNRTVIKQLKNQLHKSKIKWQNIFDQSYNFIVLLSLDGRVIEVNEVALNYGNFQLEDILDMPFWLTPWLKKELEIQTDCFKKIAQAAKGETLRFELEVINNSGRKTVLDVSLKTINDELGKARCLILEGKDISEQKRAAAIQKQKQALYTKIVETAQEGIWLIDTQGKTVYCNQHMADMLGYKVTEIQGQSLYSFLDKNSQLIAQEKFNQRKLGITKVDDLLFQHQNGSYVWAMVSAHAVLSEKGEFQGFLAMITDISARKLSEKALKESEEKFRLLVNSAPVIIFQTDTQGQNIFINNYWSNLIGYNKEYFNEESLLPIIDPRDREYFFKAWQEIIKTGEDQHLQFRYLTTNNQVVWVYGSMVAVRNNQGKIRGFLGSLIDITKQKLAEEEIKNQELAIRSLYKISTSFSLSFKQRLQGILAIGQRYLNSQVAIIALSLGNDSYKIITAHLQIQSPTLLITGQYFTFQDLCLTISNFSYMFKDYLSCNVTLANQQPGILLFLRNHDYSGFPSGSNQLLNLMAQWINYEIEKNSNKLALEQKIQRILLVEKISNKIRSSLDVEQIFQTAATEIREALQVSRCLIYTCETSPVLQISLVSQSVDSSVESININTVVNDELYFQLILNQEEAMGFNDVDSYEDLRGGQDFFEAMNIQSMLGVRTSYNQLSNGMIIVHQCENLREWKQEEIELLEAVSAQLGIAIAQANLLRQQQEYNQELALNNQALKMAKQQAEIASETKSRFLGNVTHELRSPLNAILGFTQIMQEEEQLSLKHLEYLSIIYRNGQHLLNLINDILSMSKLESQNMSLNEYSFDFEQMLLSLESIFKLRASRKGLFFNLKKGENFPQYIYADREKLRQILINLLTNGIKFTNQGRVTLTVNRNQEEMGKINQPLAQLLEKETIWLHFAIEDSSYGITSEKMQFLFEPFLEYQSGEHSQEGVGLGLAISKELVQLMGGNITVNSIVDHGTTFSFRLPVKLSLPPNHMMVSFPKTMATLAPHQPIYRILVIGDSAVESESKMLAKLLTQVGFVVFYGHNDEEAINLCNEYQPHLIWIDLDFSGVNPDEFIRRINHQLYRHTTMIIGILSSLIVGQKMRSLELDYDDCVVKPLQEEIILDKMAKFLGVSYIYETESGSISHSLRFRNFDLSKEKLSLIMSPQWLKAMNYAASCANEKLILQLIEEIPEQQVYLSQALTDLIQNFHLDKIIELTSL